MKYETKRIVEGARTIYDRGFDEGYIFLTAKIYVPPHLDNLNFQYLHYGMEDGMEDMAILILNLILNLLHLLIQNLNYNNKFIDRKTLMKLFILDLLINDLFYCYLMIKLILLFFSGVQVKSWFNNYDLDLFFFKLS